MDDVFNVAGAILLADCCVTTAVVLLAVLFVKPLRPPTPDQSSDSPPRAVSQ
jgi:hypothetical protein